MGSYSAIKSPKPLTELWCIHRQQPEDFLAETIQAIQNDCQFYNYELTQLTLPEDQTRSPSNIKFKPKKLRLSIALEEIK